MSAISQVRCFAIGAAFALPLIAGGSLAANAQTTANQTAANAPTGNLQKSHGDWRSSKLVGTTVYNDQGASIGTIDDMLIDSDGKISNVVVSVGGFLGIGSKLVEVPFDKLQFHANHANVRSETTTTPGTHVQTAMNSPPRNANEPQYYSVELPGATKNSLTSSAGFQY